MNDNKPLKVALVTGAGRGIGRAIALRLADAGASVALTYHASQAEAEALVEDLKAKGVGAIAIKADIGNADEAAAAVEATVSAFGRLAVSRT
jgi:3-oxoacyl-[acyl-carrier protein] reductase